MTRIKISVVLLILLAFAMGASFSSHVFASSSKKVEVKLAGNILEVPVDLLSNRSAYWAKDDGVVMSYILPDYTPLPLSDADAAKVLQDGHIGGLLLQNAAEKPTINDIVNNNEVDLTKREKIQGFDKLEAFNWYHGKKEKPVLYQTVYLNRDTSGKVIDLIRCKPDSLKGGPKFPICNHMFIDGGILYNIHYNKKEYLKAWKDQRASAIQLINSMKVKPN